MDPFDATFSAGCRSPAACDDTRSPLENPIHKTAEQLFEIGSVGGMGRMKCMNAGSCGTVNSGYQGLITGEVMSLCQSCGVWAVIGTLKSLP